MRHAVPDLLERRDEARRRVHAGAGRDRGPAQHVVELAPLQHGQGAGHVDAAAARPDAGDMAGLLRQRHHLVEHTEPAHRMVRIRDQTVAADLVARERLGIDQHDVEAGAGERRGAGAARRSGADDQHVAALGQCRQAEVHRRCGRVRSRP